MATQQLASMLGVRQALALLQQLLVHGLHGLLRQLLLRLLLLLRLPVALGGDELGEQAVDALADAAQLAVLLLLGGPGQGRSLPHCWGAGAGLALDAAGGPRFGRGFCEVLANRQTLLGGVPGAGGRSLGPAGAQVGACVQHAAGCGDRGAMYCRVVGPRALQREQGGVLGGACRRAWVRGEAALGA